MKLCGKSTKYLLLCLGVALLAVAFTGCSSGKEAAKAAEGLDLDYYADGNLLDRDEAKAALKEAAAAGQTGNQEAQDAGEGESGNEDGTAADDGGEKISFQKIVTENEEASQEDQDETEKSAASAGAAVNLPSGQEEEMQNSETQASQAQKDSGSSKDNEGKQQDSSSGKNKVTISIRCDTAVANGMHLESKWAGIVPASGTILATTEVEFEEGDTVFDILCYVRDKYKLHMSYTGVAGAQYVDGINNLYEFDGGRWSGWMYCVNGWYPNYGCGQYTVKNGDVIEWNYTCDLGKDLGQDWLGEDWTENHE